MKHQSLGTGNYEFSTKQENGPLGWGTTIKNIDKIGVEQFKRSVKKLGDNPFVPEFKMCKSEGGTANCPSEYVREFSGISDYKFCIAGLIVASVVAFLIIKRR